MALGKTLFSGDTGYRGIVTLGGIKGGTGANAPVILLATSGQVNINHEPIFSQGVWGAGYMNAAEQVAYANNYLRLEGSFAFQLSKLAPKDGQIQMIRDCVSVVNEFAFTNRGNPEGTFIQILPNGEQGFQGVGWCSSLSFNCSEGDVVNCDCNFQSYIDGMSEEYEYVYFAIDQDGQKSEITEEEYNEITDENQRLKEVKKDAEGNPIKVNVKNRIVTGISNNSELGASNGQLPLSPNGLFPYWASQVFTGPAGGLATEAIAQLADITSWSASYNSQVVPLKCCRQPKGLTTTEYGYAAQDDEGAPLGPDYILIGTMNADGNYTVFRLRGDFEPEAYHKDRSLRFQMAPSFAPNSKDIGVYIPTAVNQSGSTSIQNGSQYITAEFSFSAVGNGKNPPLALYVEGPESIS